MAIVPEQQAPDPLPTITAPLKPLPTIVPLHEPPYGLLNLHPEVTEPVIATPLPGGPGCNPNNKTRGYPVNG